MAYSSIVKPTDYFNTVLYTGTGSTQSITGVGFQPDWVWIKRRSGSQDHNLYDVIRGATKAIESNSSSAEQTKSDDLTAFASDGFSLGSGIKTNANTETHVAWNWLAGGTASSNTDGDITSSVSVNTTAGFSIVSYSGNGSAGATVGHGLSATPSMFWIKRRDVADSWIVYAEAIGYSMSNPDPETDFLKLNSTDARVDDNTKFNDTAPTSSVFSVGSDTSVNGSGSTFITYCFAEKKGYSKFGSYTGNGNADGTFVYTGFKPAMVIVKRTSGADRWVISDNKRDPDNPVIGELNPNDNTAEDTTSTPFDFLSNGFKLRRTGNVFNGSGETYIYMAFAESPFVTSTGIPTTAR